MVSKVAKSLNLNEATIRTILKNEQKIRTAIAAGSSISAARQRAPIMEKMEKELSSWIEDSTKKQIPLDGNMIKQNALRLYNDLKENGEFSVTSDFVASKGWFERFKSRYSLRNMTIQGERASVDNETSKKYAGEFQKIIAKHEYSPHQVFNAGETSLWWKNMKGFKTSKDHVTLLMCSNASGDYMIKPMLVYRSSNPRAMKGVNKNSLPVYWKANKRTWITESLFKEWFFNYFVPAVENYLKQNNLEFKVLLLVDNAPNHPRDLSHPNVELTFLPPNTASLIQPLDQGIISTFKTHYIRMSLKWILEKIYCESIEEVEAWKHFSIVNCIEIIALSLKEIKPSTLNACWKNVWPQSVYSGNVVEPAETEISTIVQLAKSVGGDGFDDMTTEDVQKLLHCEVTLVEMTSEVNGIKSEDDSADENSEIPNFTLNSIREGINLAEQLESYFVNADPSTERSTMFKRKLEKCLSPYHEIYKELFSKSKQTKRT
ncbi:hypothetical protein CBL_02892 [Carabus blaptoides fortunei]